MAVRVRLSKRVLAFDNLENLSLGSAIWRPANHEPDAIASLPALTLSAVNVEPIPLAQWHYDLEEVPNGLRNHAGVTPGRSDSLDGSGHVFRRA